MIKETELLDLIDKEAEIFWFDRKNDQVKKIKLVRPLKGDEYDHLVHENGYHAIKMKDTGKEFPYWRINEGSCIETNWDGEKVLVQHTHDYIGLPHEFLLEDLFKTRGEVVYRFGYNKFKRFLDKWAFDSFEDFEKCWNKLLKGETK